MRKAIYRLTAACLVIGFSLTMLSSCDTAKSGSLNNQNASEETKQVFQYLQSMFGKKVLSGQQTSCGGKELYYIHEKTGKQPAVAGFDMINQTVGWHDTAVDDAIKWHQETGGIVQFSWHWFSPMGTNGETRGNAYTYQTKFNVKNAVISGTDEYNYIVRDIKDIAECLKKLQDNHVPVLWRPLHEAGGAWFWWSGDGYDTYLKLWNIMYDILENEYKLNNLIWVWSGYSLDTDWYPGDDKCDIIASDIYTQKDKKYGITFEYASGAETYNGMKDSYSGKIIAITEMDQLPDPDLLKSEKAGWSWFMPWYGGFITSEKYNEVTMLNKAYNSDYVITADELPDWGDGSSKGISSEITRLKKG